MIVLTLEPGEDAKLAEGAPGLQRKYGMPIDPDPYARTFSSEPACRAVVAARLNAPGAEAPLLRRLRVRAMLGGLLDDPALLTAAAADVGLDPEEVERWSRMPAVEDALRADIEAARSPSPPRAGSTTSSAVRDSSAATRRRATSCPATAAPSRSRASTRSRSTRRRWPTSASTAGRRPSRSSRCWRGRPSRSPPSRSSRSCRPTPPRPAPRWPVPPPRSRRAQTSTGRADGSASRCVTAVPPEELEGVGAHRVGAEALDVVAHGCGQVLRLWQRDAVLRRGSSCRSAYRSSG